MDTVWVERLVLVVVAASVSSLVAFAVEAIKGWWAGARRRERFAEALVAVVAYEELPYVVRRRGSTDPEAERIRISTKIADVQERLAFNAAWIRSESETVADAYDALIAETKRVAGGEMRRAWEMEPIESDKQMNISDVDLKKIQPMKKDYIRAVKHHLSWRRFLSWFRFWASRRQ